MPGISPCLPFLGRNEIVRPQVLACRINSAGHEISGDQLTVLLVSINVETRQGMLHDGVTIFIMEIVEVLVSRGETMQHRSVRLGQCLWDIFQISSMNAEKAATCNDQEDKSFHND